MWYKSSHVKAVFYVNVISTLYVRHYYDLSVWTHNVTMYNIYGIAQYIVSTWYPAVLMLKDTYSETCL